MNDEKYKSLTSIAKMFDVSTAYIKKHFSSDLKEGLHYVYIGNLKRFNVNEMKKLLISSTENQNENPIMDKFLI